MITAATVQTPLTKFTEPPFAADEIGSDPNGAKAECGSMSSGFGGLGLAGMVGTTPGDPCFGEGNTGMMSGERAGGMEEEEEEEKEEGEEEMKEVWERVGIVRDRRRISGGISE